MEKKFPSKIGYLILIPICLILAVPFVLVTNDTLSWPPIFVPLIGSAFFLHIFMTTYYVIKDGDLKIRSGFIYRLDVEISTIRKINESNSILSSPATSLDRLEIIFNKYDSVLISPKEKSEFIKTMLEINPTIEVNYKK